MLLVEINAQKLTHGEPHSTADSREALIPGYYPNFGSCTSDRQKFPFLTGWRPQRTMRQLIVSHAGLLLQIWRQ